MSNYRLHYFNARGRAETIRMIFAVADQDFDDVRIERNDWPGLKNEFPFGKLPVLEVGDQKLNQSVAIMHFLALRFGLAGKTPKDAFKCHALVETLRDFVKPLFEKIMLETDPLKRLRIAEKLQPEVRTSLEQLEEIAQSAKKGFLVAGRLTYADLEFQHSMFMLSEWFGPDVLKPYPYLQKLYTNICHQPAVDRYLTNRPKTIV